MGERKVLNKYLPWDFDPSKLPKGKRPKGKLVEVRMMLPCSIRCLTCGEFMGQGKKFNSKKEMVEGEDYHGLRIWRFYGKCSNCSAVFAIKTDPSRDDYIVEMGASRNFQLWRAEEDAGEEAKMAKEEQEKYDAMRALENRTSDSKRQMNILDALDEIKALNKRNAGVDAELALQRLRSQVGEEKAGASVDVAAAEDDEAVRKAFRKRRVKRLADDVAGTGAKPAVAGKSLVQNAPKFVVAAKESLQPAAKKPRFAVRRRRATPASAVDNSAVGGGSQTAPVESASNGGSESGSGASSAAAQPASASASGTSGNGTTPTVAQPAPSNAASGVGLGLADYGSSSSDDSD